MKDFPWVFIAYIAGVVALAIFVSPWYGLLIAFVSYSSGSKED